MTDADPLMAAVTTGGQIGQAFTASTGTFTEVADNLRQKTEVTLTAEIYSQASAAFAGSGFLDSVVLDQTFNDVNLVGRPLTIGNFVNQSGIGAVFSAVTNTYSPYIQIGDDANPDPNLDEIIRGQDYQEVLTNFPIGNQVLTGLFLGMTLSGPQGPSQVYQHTILDRIGIAARQGLVAQNVTVGPNTLPALSSLDVTTVNILGSLYSPSALLAEEQQLAVVNTQFAAFQAEYAQAAPGSVQDDVLNMGANVIRSLAVEGTRIIADTYDLLSDQLTTPLANESLVKAYFDTPRITIVSSTLETAGSDSAPTYQSGLTVAVDLRKDDLRSLVAPGQEASVAFGFEPYPRSE